MFSSDRDLLTLEPTLFRDISWFAQTLALGTGSLAAGTLTLDDPLLAGTGIAPGHIVMVDRIPSKSSQSSTIPRSLFPSCAPTPPAHRSSPSIAPAAPSPSSPSPPNVPSPTANSSPCWASRQDLRNAHHHRPRHRIANPQPPRPHPRRIPRRSPPHLPPPPRPSPTTPHTPSAPACTNNASPRNAGAPAPKSTSTTTPSPTPPAPLQ